MPLSDLISTSPHPHSYEDVEFWLAHLFDKTNFLSFLLREFGITLSEFYIQSERNQVAIVLAYFTYSLRFSL